MTLATFHIDGSDYQSYATLEEADKYLRPDSRWDTWDNLDDMGKEIKLILATRMVDNALVYSGNKVVTFQPTAFPRTGLKCNGSDTSETLPVDIVNGTILLAGTLAVSPPDPEDTGEGGQLREVVAGPVEIAYFHTARSDLPPEALTPEPLTDQILKCYANQASTARPILGVTTGCPTKSSFKDTNRFDTF